jgi:hypothetical protein
VDTVVHYSDEFNQLEAPAGGSWRRLVPKEPDGKTFDEMPVKHLTGDRDLSLKSLPLTSDFKFRPFGEVYISTCTVPDYTQDDIDILMRSHELFDTDPNKEIDSTHE